MNRNVMFGAGLAAVLVGAALVFTGGTPPPSAPSQAAPQGKPLPSLAPMMAADEKPAPAEANSKPAPVSSTH